MKTAPPPVKHRARGRYSLDFAAYAAAEKYIMHNPLDRQRRAMCRLGLNVTTQTLWDQIRVLAESLKPIYESLQDYILGADVIGVDETWWRLMDKKASKRWWVWGLATPDAVWFGIDESRSAKTAEGILGDFEGTIVCDGYKAYETIARDSPRRLAQCWAHARRKFVEAEQNYPECKEAVELLGELFAIDRDTAIPNALEGEEKQFAATIRRKERQNRAPPILAKLRQWAIAQRGLPKSGKRKAIDTMFARRDALQVCIDDPFVPMHNNDTEGALRPLVVGRKNHYGSRSRRGTEAAAIYDSLLETALRNGLDPHAYLIGAAYGMSNGGAPERLLPLAHLW